MVPAPSLPDPAYQAGSISYYPTPQTYSQYNRGTWTEMLPGQYGAFHLSGGTASCAFLDAGVYTWTNGYSSDASGSLLSNELKAPDEESYAAPGTSAVANPQFWNQNGTNCAGAFNLTVVTVGAGQGIKHQGGAGTWGVELTSVRYDQFVDPTVYCVPSSNPGDANSPCAGARVTPGAVQFYMPAGSCMSQNAQGATYVFSGEQYNWIVIYQPAANKCSNTMNGGSATQYIGTIYTPGADWTINGGNRAPLAGQVIVYTATVSGGASVGIDFNPNYAPAPPAARLIN